MIRGSESNVVTRFEKAVEACDQNIILRVTGDCPIIEPEFIDASVGCRVIDGVEIFILLEQILLYISAGLIHIVFKYNNTTGTK